MNAGDGHATHMYGPLVTYANAAIIKLAGPNLYTPRILALSSAITACAIVALFVARDGPLFVAVGFSFLLLQFYKARAAYAESRPDAIAVLFSILAVLLFYIGMNRRRRWCFALGLIAMVTGFAFKQTAAEVALVPPIAILLERGARFPQRFAFSLIPLGAILAVVGSMYKLWPLGYFYVIAVPAQYGVPLLLWLKSLAIEVRYLIPLLITAVIWMIACWKADRLKTWLVACILASAPLSAAAVAKPGGQVNSYLPLFVAGVFFTMILWGDLDRACRIRFRPHSRFALSLLIGILIALDAISIPRAAIWAGTHPRHGDASYSRVIRRVRQLPGMALSPEDPTITLFAKGYAGRSLDAELDARGSRDVPPQVSDEMMRSRWVIRVIGTWDGPGRAEDLIRLGFHRVPDSAFSSGTYELWGHEPEAIAGALHRKITSASSRPHP
jgi:hypothetical protein